MCADLGGALKLGERGHRADVQATRADGHGSVFAFDFSQAHKLRRAEHAGLHHQHKRCATGNRPDRFIVGIEQL